MTRLVVDASTFLSASVARRDSPLAVLLAAGSSGIVEMVVCDRLIGEVRRGLETRYFRDRVDREARLAFEAMIVSAAVHLPDPISPPPILRDPDDDYLVALAREAQVAAIVTGDRDLLDHSGLHPPAVTARRACEMLGLIAS